MKIGLLTREIIYLGTFRWFEHVPYEKSPHPDFREHQNPPYTPMDKREIKERDKRERDKRER